MLRHCRSWPRKESNDAICRRKKKEGEEEEKADETFFFPRIKFPYRARGLRAMANAIYPYPSFSHFFILKKFRWTKQRMQALRIVVDEKKKREKKRRNYR